MWCVSGLEFTFAPLYPRRQVTASVNDKKKLKVYIRITTLYRSYGTYPRTFHIWVQMTVFGNLFFWIRILIFCLLVPKVTNDDTRVPDHCSLLSALTFARWSQEFKRWCRRTCTWIRIIALCSYLCSLVPGFQKNGVYKKMCLDPDHCSLLLPLLAGPRGSRWLCRESCTSGCASYVPIRHWWQCARQACGCTPWNINNRQIESTCQ